MRTTRQSPGQGDTGGAGGRHRGAYSWSCLAGASGL